MSQIQYVRVLVSCSKSATGRRSYSWLQLTFARTAWLQECGVLPSSKMSWKARVGDRRRGTLRKGNGGEEGDPTRGPKEKKTRKNTTEICVVSVGWVGGDLFFAPTVVWYVSRLCVRCLRRYRAAVRPGGGFYSLTEPESVIVRNCSRPDFDFHPTKLTSTLGRSFILFLFFLF